MAVPPPSPADHKAALRRDLRERRAAFVDTLAPEAHALHLAAIERRLRPLFSRSGPIAGYLAHRGEIDVLPALLAAFHLGHRIALPQITASAMRFAAWYPDAALTPGLAGIPQPTEGETLEPKILLIPLVGFDRAGQRLGQGGGFYDRWCAAHPAAMRIGMAWSVQEVGALRPDPWDVPLHAIVTEREWIEP